jgi:hypothetical protein
MTKQEVISRLCLLMTTVNEKITNYEDAADCICENQHKHIYSEYRNSGKALEFIEKTVKEALNILNVSKNEQLKERHPLCTCSRILPWDSGFCVVHE